MSVMIKIISVIILKIPMNYGWMHISRQSGSNILIYGDIIAGELKKYIQIYSPECQIFKLISSTAKSIFDALFVIKIYVNL